MIARRGASSGRKASDQRQKNKGTRGQVPCPIHQNPVKAGLVADNNLSEYKWSSYQEYIGKRTITDIDLALSLFSEDRRLALALFKEYNSAVNNDQCLEDVEVKAILSRQGIKNNNQLLKLTNPQRDEIIKELKSVKGVTLRQSARITGILKSTIERI
jgi:putative transposase